MKRIVTRLILVVPLIVVFLAVVPYLAYADSIGGSCAGHPAGPNPNGLYCSPMCGNLWTLAGRCPTPAEKASARVQQFQQQSYQTQQQQNNNNQQGYQTKQQPTFQPIQQQQQPYVQPIHTDTYTQQQSSSGSGISGFLSKLLSAYQNGLPGKRSSRTTNTQNYQQQDIPPIVSTHTQQNVGSMPFNVVGDANFRTQVINAVAILKQSPPDFQYVSQHLNKVFQNPTSGVYTENASFACGPETAQDARWLASVFIHESCHVERYRQGIMHANDPTGEERACFPRQADFLDVIGWHERADWVRQQDGSHVYMAGQIR